MHYEIRTAHPDKGVEIVQQDIIAGSVPSYQTTQRSESCNHPTLKGRLGIHQRIVKQSVSAYTT